MFTFFKKLWRSIMTLTRIQRIFYHKTYPSTNCNVQLTDPQISPTILSVVSWNIQGLFYFLHRQKINNILRTLHSFTHDVITLQEVFDDSLKRTIIESMKYSHPYYVLGSQKKKFIFFEDSGLLVLSKYPLFVDNEIRFKGLVPPDCLSMKSALYFSVGNIHFCTSHLQSSNMSDCEDISCKQITDILSTSYHKNMIFIGDLNNNSAYKYIPTEKNNYDTTWNDEILDYILPTGNMLVKDVNVLQINLQDVSDHYPIEGIVM